MPTPYSHFPRHLAPPGRAGRRSRRAVSILAAMTLPLVAVTASTTPTAAADDGHIATKAAPEAAAVDTQFGTTLYTGNGDSRTEAMRRQTALYGPLGVVRLFSNGLPTSWSSLNSSIGQTPAVISFNPSPTAVLSGQLDNQLSQWFNQAPTNRVTRWVYWHEPEDDAQRGQLNLTQYRAAWQHLARLADRAGNPKLRATLVLMCWTLSPGSGRDWRDYYAGDATIDGLGFDCYNGGHRKGRYRPVEDMFEPANSLAARLGMPWGIAEMGSIVVAGGGGQQGRARWLRDAASYLRSNGAAFASYFDSDVGTDFRLHDTPSRQAWRDIV